MNKPCLIDLIKQSMTLSNGNKFNLTLYSKNAAIHRTSIYSKYEGGKPGLFAAALTEQLQQKFINSDKKNCSYIVQDILIEIKKYWKVYRWMYDNATHSERCFIRRKLQHVLFKELKEYTFMRQGISYTKLQAICNLMYCGFLDWVIHGCQEKINDIYQGMRFYLPVLDGYRCNCYFNQNKRGLN